MPSKNRSKQARQRPQSSFRISQASAKNITAINNQLFTKDDSKSRFETTTRVSSAFRKRSKSYKFSDNESNTNAFDKYWTTQRASMDAGIKKKPGMYLLIIIYLCIASVRSVKGMKKKLAKTQRIRPQTGRKMKKRIDYTA